MSKSQFLLGFITASSLPIMTFYFFQDLALVFVSLPFTPILYLVGYNIIIEEEDKLRRVQE